MLVYALVSRGKTVLAENTGASNASGNFEVIARMVLSKLDEKDIIDTAQSKRSIEVENHTFHVLAEDGLFFVTLADRTFSPRVAFAFLGEVKSKFLSTFKKSEWEVAIAHSFNADFSGALSFLMTRYNNEEINGSSNSATNKTGSQGDQQIAKIKNQLEEVKDVLRTDIDSLLNRGERIELLVDTTERLTQASFKFQESATRLKNEIWWKNRKNQFAMAGFLIFILLLIAVTSCGGLDFQNC
jgi:vesicle-associated membrane protein 7